MFGFAQLLEFEAASRRALERKLEKDPEWSVQKDIDVVTGAKETTEFATEEEPTEEFAEDSTMAAALLLVDCPE